MTAVRIHNEPESSVALKIGVIVGALGALVLVGWMFNLPVIRSVFPGRVTMKATTAMAKSAGFILVERPSTTKPEPSTASPELPKTSPGASC
jgi:hypothetical protein